MLGLAVVFVAGVAAGAIPAAVWPPPRSVNCPSAQGITLSSSISIGTSGPGSTNNVTTDTIDRYTPLLEQIGVRGGELITLAISVGPDTGLTQSTDYSYSITLSSSSTLTAKAASPYAVSYVLETLTQFVGEGGVLACGQGFSVDDAPAFSHRGIMIDTGRRFYPVALVKQTLDGMAMTKQNVLHFHLSEQCFRVQSKVFPQLTATCVDSRGNNTAFYSQDEIADIVEYARLRGIRVLPEFDMPGHSGGFCSSLASEGISCCNGFQIEDDPAGKSVAIVSSVLTEMAGLFPDAVMNIGCDETGSAPPCTTDNAKSFEVKMIEHVRSLGKTPMGWEEILFKTGAAANFTDTIIDSWHTTSWNQAAEQGHSVVMSNDPYFYLDSPGHSARHMWFNMTALGTATPQQSALLLGGETSMWQDVYVNSCLFPNDQDGNFSESVAGCIWPRAAIAAGSFWGYYDSTKTLDDATFNATQQRLVKRGIPSCPCATLDSTSCSQLQRCGETYCPPPPPPPPPSQCGTAAPWKCLFAVPCNASDPDQSVLFDPTAGTLKTASGLCADAVDCKQVDTLSLAACDPSSKTQQWEHSDAKGDRFVSIGCNGQCIDCYYGGVGNPGLYTCDGDSNQKWVATGHTFSESYAGQKCMSQAPAH